MGKKARIITVAGKGGVGKTSICASIVRLLVENCPDKKILAIDADPAVGLSVALGVDVKMTLDDIRQGIVDSVENGETRMKRYLPIGITADERVCSGAHYARFFTQMKHFLAHPELLETPPEEVRFDEGCEYHEPKPAPCAASE